MGASKQAAPNADLTDLFGSRRLPVRVEPLEDELFSSWFVRSAQANGLRVHQLARSLMGRDRPLYAGDPDRGVWHTPALALATAMDLQKEAAIQTFLKSYEGYLWPSVPDHGVWQNVLPIANATRQTRLYGLQYCAQCLRTDKQPYFRKHWRLAFYVVCDLHGCALQDRCPHCGEPIVLHRLNAGDTRFRDLKSLSMCYSCGGSLTHDALHRDNALNFIEFQKTLMMSLHRGWIVMNGRCVHSILFFQGLRMLISLMEDTRRNGKLTKSLAPDLNSEHFANRYGGYEARSLGRRSEVLQLVCQLLQNGTEAMALLCARNGVRLQDIHRYHIGAKVTIPYWLWEPLHFHIDGTNYSPTDAEIENATRYAFQTQNNATQSDVCSLLNMRTRSNPRVAKAWHSWKERQR